MMAAFARDYAPTCDDPDSIATPESDERNYTAVNAVASRYSELQAAMIHTLLADARRRID